MSYSPTVDTYDTDRDGIRRLLLPVGLLTFTVSSVWTVLGAHDMTEVAVVLPIAALVAVGVYGFLLPRALGRTSAGGTALALSVVAVVLTLPAFWSGWPLILGAAGVLLGYAGRNAASGAGKSIAGVVLGALAVLGYLTIYIIDGLLLGNL